MQTDPTACHSLIGSLAALLRSHGAAPTGRRGRRGHVPFGNNEQGDLASGTGRGTATDSSSDSNTGGRPWSMASCGAEGAQVADTYERL
jgi:hypothetical protein